MLLALSDPHNHRPINVVGARIPLWPMDRPSRLRVLRETGVHSRVGVRLGRVARVVGDRGRGLPLVGHGVGRELVHLLAWVCLGVGGEVAAALVVRDTCHHHASAACLLVLRGPILR